MAAHQASVYDEQQKRSHSVRIDAKVVVTACGSIHSPALLLRSGLRNPNIGKHLRYCTALIRDAVLIIATHKSEYVNRHS